MAGYVVPFGSFLNTTIATMADLTGINAARFFTYKITGKQLDFATQEGAEAFGKMAEGWSAIAIGIPQAREKISEGLSWNQDRNEDGSINDRTFEWPNSTIRVMQQIFAHGLEIVMILETLNIQKYRKIYLKFWLIKSEVNMYVM